MADEAKLQESLRICVNGLSLEGGDERDALTNLVLELEVLRALYEAKLQDLQVDRAKTAGIYRDGELYKDRASRTSDTIRGCGMDRVC